MLKVREVWYLQWLWWEFAQLLCELSSLSWSLLTKEYLLGLFPYLLEGILTEKRWDRTPVFKKICQNPGSHFQPDLFDCLRFELKFEYRLGTLCWNTSFLMFLSSSLTESCCNDLLKLIKIWFHIVWIFFLVYKVRFDFLYCFEQNALKSFVFVTEFVSKISKLRCCCLSLVSFRTVSQNMVWWVTLLTVPSICVVSRANMPMSVIDKLFKASVNGLKTIIHAIGRLNYVLFSVDRLILLRKYGFLNSLNSAM